MFHFLPFWMMGLEERDGEGESVRDVIWISGAVDHIRVFRSSPSILPRAEGFRFCCLLISHGLGFPRLDCRDCRSPFVASQVLWVLRPGCCSHRASRCHPIPGELLRMEVIYWWPLCLFSLPLLLVLLSALLSYLAAKGCLCVCMCVCMCVCVCVCVCLYCICFTGVPPMNRPVGVCDWFAINLYICKVAKVGGNDVLLKSPVLKEDPWSVTNLI